MGSGNGLAGLQANNCVERELSIMVDLVELKVLLKSLSVKCKQCTYRSWRLPDSGDKGVPCILKI